MIVFISDLHLMDGTAGKHYLGVETFRDIFKEIAIQAQDAGVGGSSNSKVLKIVLLGDIFDLVRTETWFIKKQDGKIVDTITVEDRPWGNPSDKTEKLACEIFDNIVKENSEIIDIISCKNWKDLGFPIKPEVVYIPGNHDRLCNLYASLRDRVTNSLGLDNLSKNEKFSSIFKDKQHGVFARHGHEYDSFNFTGSYDETPIGDVIAAEIASKLPISIQKHLNGTQLSSENQQVICDHFRNLFDIRPLTAIIHWLFYQVEHSTKYDKDVKEKINLAFQEVGEEFVKLDFVKRWIRQNDLLWNPMDQADIVQMLISILRTFNMNSFKWQLSLWEKSKYVRNLFTTDHYLDGAVKDFNNEAKDYQYLLYGHTHQPLQKAINIIDKDKEQLYLNTGTWRPAYYQTTSKTGFTSWNNLTYTIIYQPGEFHAGKTIIKPRFEVWTGAMKN
ncbi:metallophosphoesterase [Bacillus marasmi]|uniref:metallophosphoesterase n=1 Tax=Bacillus marasmi TaxID=1926279 RepID=UPI0011C731AF|nr:metallophosphoesterase [Bacillus marasmi]